MPYIRIKRGEIIYIPVEKEEPLLRAAAGNPLDYMRSFVSKEYSKKLAAKLKHHIDELEEKDTFRFNHEWRSIRLYGESAQNNLFEIISCYINVTGIGKLRSLGDYFGDNDFADVGKTEYLPYGPLFVFEITQRRSLFRKPAHTVLFIDANTVDKIIGEFPSFTIYCNGIDISFGEKISIQQSRNTHHCSPLMSKK